MRILICYTSSPGTTGNFIEEALKQEHEVTFCGTGDSRLFISGYHGDLDVAEFAKAMPQYPDLFLYIASAIRCFPKGLERLQCPTAGYLIDVHLQAKDLLELSRFFDSVLIGHSDYLPLFRDINPYSHWLPVACAPDVHHPVQCVEQYEVGFVGRSRLKLKGQVPRAHMLKHLSQLFSMNDFNRSYGPEEMSLVYGQSKMVFNYPVNNDLNMRFFEALACQKLLVTKRIANGQDTLFREGEHFVAYDGLDDLVEVIRFYLEHDDERERIARQGYELVLSKHTYRIRVEEMLDMILAEGGRFSAPIRKIGLASVATHYMRAYARRGMVDAVCDVLASGQCTTILHFLSGNWLILKAFLNRTLRVILSTVLRRAV